MAMSWLAKGQSPSEVAARKGNRGLYLANCALKGSFFAPPLIGFLLCTNMLHQTSRGAGHPLLPGGRSHSRPFRDTIISSATICSNKCEFGRRLRTLYAYTQHERILLLAMGKPDPTGLAVVANTAKHHESREGRSSTANCEAIYEDARHPYGLPKLNWTKPINIWRD